MHGSSFCISVLLFIYTMSDGKKGLCALGNGATVHFFADANPIFALIPKPTNQLLRNNYIVYGVVRYN